MRWISKSVRRNSYHEKFPRFVNVNEAKHKLRNSHQEDITSLQQSMGKLRDREGGTFATTAQFKWPLWAICDRLSNAGLRF